MATEDNLSDYPQLDPILQKQISTTIQRVAKICLKICYKENKITNECIEQCTTNYIQAYDIVLEELKKLSEKHKN